MKVFVIFLIKFYQRYISLDTGIFSCLTKRPICRFHPTCSQYFLEAVEGFGTWKGIGLGFRRIIKCHPWHKGGIDLVKK